MTAQFWVGSRHGTVTRLTAAAGRLVRRAEQTIDGDDLAALAIHPGGRTLYASVRSLPGIVCFDVDPHGDAFAPRDVVRHDAPFVHLAVTPAGDALIGADYAGEIALFTLGGSDRTPRLIQQLAPGRHPHAALASADTLWIGLLGDDALVQMPLRAGAAVPQRALRTELPSGFGPRHIALTPDGAVVIGERQGAVAHVAAGARTPDAVWSILPAGADLAPGVVRQTPDPEPTHAPDGRPLIWAADVVAAPDGRTVYATERRTSTLSVSSLDSGGGHLNATLATEPRPRGLDLDRSGRHLLVSGELSDTVTLYDAQLTVLDRAPVAPGSVWVQAG